MRSVRRRQVHNLAPIPDQLILGYAADVKCCPGCRANVSGTIPTGVNAPAQNGPEITTRVADVVVGTRRRIGGMVRPGRGLRSESCGQPRRRRMKSVTT